MGKHWTKEEIELLKEKYPNKLNTELSIMLNRSADSISLLGRKLGLKKSEETMKRVYSRSSERMKDDILSRPKGRSI